MFSDLNVFRLAHAMASHAGQRQAVIARNVANVDTPGYRARDVEPFAGVLAGTDARQTMRASRAAHLNGARGTAPGWAETVPDGASGPNGNSVSVEQEMLKATEVRRQHDRAIAIYKSALGVLRAGLGRG